MNFSPFLNTFIEQLTNLGAAAFSLVKILLGMLITVFNLIASFFTWVLTN